VVWVRFRNSSHSLPQEGYMELRGIQGITNYNVTEIFLLLLR